MLSPTGMKSAFHTILRFIPLFFSGLRPMENNAASQPRRWNALAEIPFAGFAPAFSQLPNNNYRCG